MARGVENPVARRRTFAIISDPDTGKTTRRMTASLMRASGRMR